MAELLAKEASVVVSDYSYIFNARIRNSFFSRIDKVLDDIIVIVDEAHNLPGRIRDLASERITNFTLKNAANEARKLGNEELAAKLQHLFDVLAGFGAAMASGSEKLVRKEEFVAKVGEIGYYEEFIDELEAAADEVRSSKSRSFIGGVGDFLRSWLGPDAGFVRIFSSNRRKSNTVLSLSYRCLDPSMITKEVVDAAHSTILMSGTLQPTSMYKDLIGFNDQALEDQYESPFHEKNKLTLIVPETTTKFSMRSEQQFARIAEICAGIVNTVPGNTAIFFPSYAIRDSVNAIMYDRCEKTTFVEQQGMTKEEKTELLNQFRSYEKAGAVLLGTASGSFGEGIDLPGDLLKCVVVVGLPLQQPDLETKELIQYYDKKFSRGWDYGYLFPAFNRALQSAGRCIRSETDKGVVIFLDERYVWPMYKRCFPPDSDITVTTHYKEMIEEFFAPTQRRLV